MNLIAQRPTEWNAVVGQQRAVTILQAVLKNPHLMLKGFLFYGTLGVGKTTTAYLLARALMCKGSDPLGCGKCTPCTMIAETGIDSVSDFKEVDGAENSGVDHARQLMELWGGHTNITGKRRVIVIDEAHRLSTEAWDVFLKPLEQGDTSVVFIFVSNQAESIKGTIRSRCTQIPFELVHQDTVVGLLANVATRNNIQYEIPALRLIARYTKGVVRNALNVLGSAAALGVVTVDNVRLILDTSLEDACVATMQAIAGKDRAKAVQLVDDAGRLAPPSKIIETMFSVYGRAVFAPPDESLAKVFSGLPDTNEVTTIFLKWSTTTHLPQDSLPVFVLELLKAHSTPAIKEAQQRAANASGGVSGVVFNDMVQKIRTAPPEGVFVEEIPAAKPITPEDAAAFLNEDEPEPEAVTPVVAVVASEDEAVEDEPEPVAVAAEEEVYEDEPM